MKIVLHGYGKMGHAIEAIAKERGHQVIEIFDENRQISAEPVRQGDVIIDFSHASALDDVLRAACSGKVNLVIGTTGWNDRLDTVRAECEHGGIGAVYAANFSPGANIVFALAREAGKLFARFPQYESGMEERHHSKKKDAPSGTALRIASEVKGGSEGKLDPKIVSSRVGSEFGLHTLFFDSPDDLVEISHRARGREGFARGAVLAAEMLQGKKGLFRFEELIGLEN